MTIFFFNLVNFEISIVLSESKTRHHFYFNIFIRNNRVNYTLKILKSIAMLNKYINTCI